jgi:hypothetical protein
MESYVNSCARAEPVFVISYWCARGRAIVRSCICSALFADPPDGRRDSVLLVASHTSVTTCRDVEEHWKKFSGSYGCCQHSASVQG